jgi:hypothetical protein
MQGQAGVLGTVRVAGFVQWVSHTFPCSFSIAQQIVSHTVILFHVVTHCFFLKTLCMLFFSHPFPPKFSSTMFLTFQVMFFFSASPLAPISPG